MVSILQFERDILLFSINSLSANENKHFRYTFKETAVTGKGNHFGVCFHCSREDHRQMSCQFKNGTQMIKILGTLL